MGFSHRSWHLVFFLAALHGSVSLADGKRDKYLANLSGMAEEGRINVVIDIGHTLFKKYCPKEHNQMMSYLQEIIKIHPTMTGDELEDQKQGALVVFSEPCENKPSLVAFSENLNGRLEALSTVLLKNVTRFFDKKDANLTLKTKNKIARLYFERELGQTFTVETILKGAHFNEAFDSPTYFSYLTLTQDLDTIRKEFK